MFFYLKKIKKITGVFAVVLLSLAFLLTSCAKKAELIAEGVTIAHVDVGGMTEKEAASALKKYENFAKDMVLDFVCEGVEFEIPASQLELKLDAEKSANRAYLVGRGDNKKANKEEIKKARTKGVDVTPSLVLDTDKLILATNDYLADVISDPSPMTVEYGTDCLIVTNAREGKVVSHEKATEAIEKELSDLKADDFVELVTQMYKPKNLTFEEFKKEYVHPAKDAVYTKDGDKHHIQPEVIGVEIDEKEAKNIFEKNKSNKQSYRIPAKITTPDITASYLEDKYVNKIISKYSTSFAGSSAGRCTNIALAASKIDGYVLNPGERFSYNKVVGPRTAEAGFKTAHVYVGTKVVDGIGGGICQVSSTLYNAVVMADLKTVSRTNHSIPVDYVPRGKDATVSYGTIDYVFENDKPYPVSIKAKIDGTTLTVSVVGTSTMDYTVEFVSSYVSPIAYATVQKEDDTIPEGETKVITPGSDGSVYESYRVYKKDGKEYDRKFESRSRYQPVTAEVAVGTMKPEEEITEEETSEAEISEDDIQEPDYSEPESSEEKTEEISLEITAETDAQELIEITTSAEQESVPEEQIQVSGELTE